MKKIALIFLTFLSLSVFGQIEVKEGSFKKIDGYVMFDKYEHTDINNAPMALIKISTENITSEQRRKFTFKGNLATYFDVHFEPGEIYLYISAAAATFIEIIHDDFGKIEYRLPYDLCDFCGYEMVVSRIVQEQNLISINSKPEGATIFMDGVNMGMTPDILSNLSVGIHELKLEKEGYLPLIRELEIKKDERMVLDIEMQIDEEYDVKQESKEIAEVTVSVDSTVLDTLVEVAYVDDDTLSYEDTLSYDETLQSMKTVKIITDQSGDEIYVDDVYVGLSPVTTDISYGIHVVNAKREDMNEIKVIEIVDDGEDCVVRMYFDNISFTVNGVEFTMVKVIGGSFEMGATNEQENATDDEYPVHTVALNNYHIGETEVTQQLWEAVMGKNPSKYKNEQNPVENITWYDCQKFVEKLNALTGENFRLPTESEWEYAARGGNKSQGYQYAGSNDVDEVAWHKDNSMKGRPCEVMKLRSNELGLYDMSGNVCEWCYESYLSYDDILTEMTTDEKIKEDEYVYYSDGRLFYTRSRRLDRMNDDLMSNPNKVLRGGCCYYYPTYCRVSYRFNRNSKSSYSYCGLRLAL